MLLKLFFEYLIKCKNEGRAVHDFDFDVGDVVEWLYDDPHSFYFTEKAPLIDEEEFWIELAKVVHKRATPDVETPVFIKNNLTWIYD